MREILFRGKQINTGKWVEGYFVEQDNPRYYSYIIGSFIAEVDDRHTDVVHSSIYNVGPETVVQYTGLTDKNGMKIFEGDIVKTESELFCNCGIGTIEFLKDWCIWYISGDVQNGLGDIANGGEIEVIGNIHDDPELLEVEE